MGTNCIYRSIIAIVIAFISTLILLERSVRKAYIKSKVGQPIRVQGSKYHLIKKNTPIVGEQIILVIIIVNVILAKKNNKYAIIALLTMVLFAVIGKIDDYQKVEKKERGIGIGSKITLQTIASAIVVCIYCKYIKYEKDILIPQAWIVVDVKSLYFPICMLILIYSSNATNLTDGLDGLASINILIISIFMIIICNKISDEVRSFENKFIYIKEIDEISILLATIIGSNMGFLWYNVHPAKIFMGDTASLSIGAVIGIIAIITKQEIILLSSACIMAVEVCSVILQVMFFRITKKRILRMSPLHHHYEQAGMPEFTITVRISIITLMLNIAFMLLLK